MFIRSLARQVSRTIYISRRQTAHLFMSAHGENNLFNSPVIGTAQIYLIKQYSSSGTVVIPVVAYEEIKQLSKHPKKLLIDVREPKELQETGQIPTSINIPLAQVVEELGTGVKAEAFKAKYGREKPQKNTEIIFYCRSGKRAQNAAETAKSLGYTKSKNYLGSWTEWAEKEGLSK